MKPARRTPRSEISTTDQVAVRFGISRRLAQLTVSRGLQHRCEELAALGPEEHERFVAAAQALAVPRRLRRATVALPMFPPLAEMIERCSARPEVPQT